MCHGSFNNIMLVILVATICPYFDFQDSAEVQANLVVHRFATHGPLIIYPCYAHAVHHLVLVQAVTCVVYYVHLLLLVAGLCGLFWYSCLFCSVFTSYRAATGWLGNVQQRHFCRHGVH